MNTIELLQQLSSELKEQTTRASQLMNQDEKTLQKNPAPGKWNVLQCIEHLNSYARHYLPAFEKAMEHSQARGWAPSAEITSTWLGKKCIQSVLVTTTKKMKTPKRHNHIEKQVNKKALDEFLQHQQRLEKILQQAAGVNLPKTKVRIEIMPLLRLHLGDFLQFFIYHQTRHLAQAERCLKLI